MKNTVGAKVAIGVCALVMGIAVWAQRASRTRRRCQRPFPPVLPPMSAPKACRTSRLLRLLSPPPPR
jgi:hypothetical protein